MKDPQLSARSSIQRPDRKPRQLLSVTTMSVETSRNVSGRGSSPAVWAVLQGQSNHGCSPGGGQAPDASASPPPVQGSDARKVFAGEHVDVLGE